MNDKQVQAQQVEAWLRLLLDDDQVVELRALKVTSGTRSFTYAGYYDTAHLQALVREALRHTASATGVYVTLNPLRPEVLLRRQYSFGIATAGSLTTDADVRERRWLMLDIDPVRVSGISATDAEKASAWHVVEALLPYLQSLGWPAPIGADSGNGYHLLYRIDLPTEDQSLVRRVLELLAQRFDTPQAKVDRAVHNPARLCKVPGTLARKGTPTTERPHRRSGLLTHTGMCDPSQPASVVTRAQLEQLVASLQPPRHAQQSRTARPSRSSEANKRLRVADWLTDCGIKFRVKPQPDAHGRTIYVLECCPFNPAHRDPDACVMQGADGRMAAKCLHNSCAGNGWQEFKKMIGKPTRAHYDGELPPAAPSSSRPDPDAPSPTPNNTPAAALPEIIGNERQLPEIAEDAWQALLVANTPPRWFCRGGHLAQIVPPIADRVVAVEPLGSAALRGVFARVANWFVVRHLKHDDITEPSFPPQAIVEDVLAWVNYPDLPVLLGTTECPFFVPDGTLVTTSGYNAAAKMWYEADPQLDLPPVPEHPTSADIFVAKQLLLDELFGDFPFADDASKAHALAGLLLPFVRPLIDGPTPLHLIDAPTEGSGKTLLVKVISMVALGRDVHSMTQPSNEEEFRKRLTATLFAAPPLVLLDNINYTLDSAALASVLTDTAYKDRLLGESRMLELPNRCLWFATGNNVTMSREIARRVLGCRLDAHDEMPSLRCGFRHSPLLPWVKANRGRLIHAALTLIRAWIVAGRPKGTEVLGMFEAWAEVMGGILQVIGVPGLLANRREYTYKRSNANDWGAFVRLWWEQYADQQVGVAVLFRLADENELLQWEMGDGNEQSRRTKLGIELRKRIDRIFGDYQLIAVEDDRSGRQQFKLLAAKKPNAPMPPPTEPPVSTAAWTDSLVNLRH